MNYCLMEEEYTFQSQKTEVQVTVLYDFGQIKVCEPQVPQL